MVANTWVGVDKDAEQVFECQNEYFTSTHLDVASKALDCRPVEPFSNRYTMEVAISGVVGGMIRG
jgi:hypothetical protein